LAEVDAVKDGHVYVINRGIMDATAHFVGISYLARWFYPELFDDPDPKMIHQEYLTEFQGLDFDLNEHGVFAYPPIEIDGGLAGIPDRYRG
jgi:iron complex transport system substrate-binding protein